ncbi:type 1 glutamine amidotransferase [Propioniciclava soli]|uniref:Type 1 glutamine amidotransferase n=1 Tax=Propioniciclava soli TaxID=2775081 RepID=A0ABZ3C9X6_9ACTN
MTRLTVLQLDDAVPLDRFGPWLRDAGARVTVVDVPGSHRAGRGVPGVDALGHGLVVLGGRMSAHDTEAHPWLTALAALLADCVEVDLPVLGICLGHQILAEALGGQVRVADPGGGEVGPVALRWAEAAASDPVLAGAVAAGQRVAESHHDVVSHLPAGAIALASSAAYPHQAFRVGSALGVQFHPEAGPALVGRWEELSGHDPTPVVVALAAVDAEVSAVGRAVAEGFVRVCTPAPH